MRAHLQRVKNASVTVDGKITGEIEKGILILLGITHEDTVKDIEFLVEKIVNLRIFPGEKSTFDRSLLETGYSALVVSQFTLYADLRKGRRPDFTDAAKPDIAIPLYEAFLASLKKRNIKTEAGIFGAMMEVSLVNDGPVTILLDSEVRRKS